MAEDNLFDIIAELKEITADLRRTVYGDKRNPGLLDEIDRLRGDVSVLGKDLENVKGRKPIPIAWMAGYVAFCIGVIFAIAALLNQMPGHEVMGLSGNLALVLALLFGVAAMVLLIVGFGWLRHE